MEFIDLLTQMGFMAGWKFALGLVLACDLDISTVVDADVRSVVLPRRCPTEGQNLSKYR